VEPSGFTRSLRRLHSIAQNNTPVTAEDSVTLYIYIVQYWTLNVKRKNPKIDIFFAENINMKIEGLTVQEIADALNISYNTAHKRLERSGIQPLTTGAIYPKEALEAIRNTPGKGRPKKGALGK
jgi:hypothetical protein